MNNIDISRPTVLNLCICVLHIDVGQFYFKIILAVNLLKLVHWHMLNKGWEAGLKRNTMLSPCSLTLHRLLRDFSLYYLSSITVMCPCSLIDYYAI